MIRFRLTIACVLLVVSTSWSGCSGPATANRIEGMQRELRYFEDRVYDLDYENEWLCVENERLKQRLARCQSEAEQLKVRPDTPPRKPRFLEGLLIPPKTEIEDGPPIVPGKSASEPTPRRPRPSKSVAPVEEQPPKETMPKGRTVSPPSEEDDTEIEIGPTPSNGTKPQNSPFKDDPETDGRETLGPGVPRPTNPARSLPGARNPAGSGTRARKIPRNLMHSRVAPRGLRVIAAGSHGIDTDGEPGDDAIALVIEPVDREGEFVDAVGTLRVTVTDPAHVGANSHVVTQSFTADQLLDGASVHPSSNGYRIEIPFNEKLPRHDKLRIAMVLYTQDGQELDTMTDVIVRRQKVDDVAMRVSNRHAQEPAAFDEVQPANFEAADDHEEWSARPKSRQQPVASREAPSRRDDSRRSDSRRSSSIELEPIRNKVEQEPTPAEPLKARKERPAWSPNR